MSRFLIGGCSGLASFFSVKCAGCGYIMQLKPPKITSSNLFEINVHAVW